MFLTLSTCATHEELKEGSVGALSIGGTGHVRFVDRGDVQSSVETGKPAPSCATQGVDVSSI